MNITVYDKKDGKILKTMTGGPEVTKYIADDEEYIEGLFPEDGKIIKGEYVPTEYKFPKHKISFPDQAIQFISQGKPACLKALQNLMTETEAQAFLEEHYRIYRKRAYPPMADYLDAQAKINSTDAAFQVDGRKQLQDYYKECLQVKELYPK